MKPPVSRNRSLLWLTLIAVAALGVVQSNQGSAQGSKPIVTSRMSTEYSAPPATLREMALVADVVVRARVVGSGPQDRQNGQRIQTAYHFRITDILQNFGHPVGDENKPLRVLRYGGDRDRGDKIVRAYESGFPQFVNGAEFLMFLHWNAHEQLWEIMWGPAGLIEVTSGNAKAWSKVGPVTSAHGRAATEVIEAIKLLKSLGGK